MLSESSVLFFFFLNSRTEESGRKDFISLFEFALRILTLQLHEQKRLDLEENVSSILPSLSSLHHARPSGKFRPMYVNGRDPQAKQWERPRSPRVTCKVALMVTCPLCVAMGCQTLHQLCSRQLHGAEPKLPSKDPSAGERTKRTLPRVTTVGSGVHVLLSWPHLSWLIQ